MADGKPSRRFEPVHNAHAIEQVLLTVQFATPLNDADASAVDALVSEQFVRDDRLPKRSQLRTMVLAIGTPGVVPPGIGGLSGFVYQRFKNDGSVETELKCERQAILFRTERYTRWVAVWGEARSYLAAVLPIYLRSARLGAIGLTYIDKFVGTGQPQEARAGDLLRRDSPYVAPHVFDAEDFWHSHTGAFIRVDGSTKRLLNINVDCADEARPSGLARTVTITTVLNDFFNQPGYSELAPPPDPLAFVEGHLDDLHTFDKSVLGALLTDEMAKRIALEA